MMPRILLLIPLLLLAGCSLPRIAVIKDPLSAEEHLQRAVIAESNGDFDLALRSYREAARDLPQARLGMANVYFQTGRLEEAEQEYRRVIRRLPSNAYARNNLAWLYLTQGRLAEAERMAADALTLDPGNPDFLDTMERIGAALGGH
jgi:tetratricopeptide (TPR) repeat protein